MNRLIAVPATFLLLGVAVVSCNSPPFVNPIVQKKLVSDDVHVSMQIDKKEQKTLMGERYTFVYFKYTISNQRKKGAVHFHPGHIRIRYNGFVNESTEYDSLASAMTESVELPKGLSDYFLYLVFKLPDLPEDGANAEILDTGISMGTRK